MRWQGRRESDNVEDRRNDSPGMGGGGGRQIRLPRGKGGIILLIVVAVAGITVMTSPRCCKGKRR